MSSKLLTIELSLKERKHIIITNFVKMLISRKELDSSKIEEYIDNIIKSTAATNKFYIKTENTKWAGMLISTKLTSIKKDTHLIDFLAEDSNIHKIIIVKDLSKKVYTSILGYTNAEAFFEWEMMANVIDHQIIPKHIVLTTDEAEKYKKEYGDNLQSIMYTTDRIARYYGMKVGDIVKIIRPSITTGYSCIYRRLMMGSNDLLFH
jgi:DNA-directed RNA polymerase I, II, and III subunit RPABC1